MTMPIEIIDTKRIMREYDPDFFRLFQGRVRSIELTEGCSIQCPFCYLDIGQLVAAFDSKGIVEELKENPLLLSIFKKDARIGYQSEPLDNEGVVDVSRVLLESGLGLTLITAVSRLNPHRLLDAIQLAKEYDWTRDGNLSYEKGFHLQISVTPQNYQRICKVLDINESVDASNAIPIIERYTTPERTGACIAIRDRITLDEGLDPVGRGFDLEKLKAKYRLWEGESEIEWLTRVSSFLNYNARGKTILRPSGFYVIDTCLLDKSNGYTGRGLIKITNDNFREIYDQFVRHEKGGGDL